MKKRIALKALLSIQTLSILVYTVYVGMNSDWSFIKVALDNITALNWNGQFVLDFSCYLVLSATWIMWRNHFSWKSIVIATFAAILGIVFLAPYLFILLITEKGDIKRVLTGQR